MRLLQTHKKETLKLCRLQSLKSYHISHPGFYKNKKLYFKEQKASLVRIKNICVLLMTIFRKTWRSIAHEGKNAIKH